MPRQAKRRSKIIRPLRGGQMTIPAEFREALGIGQDTLLRVTLEGGEIRISPLRLSKPAEDASWIKELYEIFAPVRSDLDKYSDEEVDQAIQQALTAVRRRPVG